MVLGRLAVHRADADVAPGGQLLELGLPRRVGDVGGERLDVEVGPALLEPLGRQLGLESADGGGREDVPVDVVGLVHVRLDERHPGDPHVAGEQVEHDDPAAAGADLEDVGHGGFGIQDSGFRAKTGAGVGTPESRILTPESCYFASGSGHSPVSCQIS